jgi:hypothetical protein
MEIMNHGLIAIEPGVGHVGSAVWAAFGAHVGLAVFGAPPAGRPAYASEEGVFVRHIAGIESGIPDDEPIDYSRYEVLDRASFSALCFRAFAYGGTPVLAFPITISDENAILTLQDFWSQASAINRSLNSLAPIEPILQQRRILADWVYAVGFHFDTSVTFFLSSDRASVQKIHGANSDVEGYRVLEEW